MSGANTPLSNSSDLDSSDDDLIASYVKLKLRIGELTTDRKPVDTSDAAFIRMLQQRLEEIQKDYLFDAKEAEIIYKQELRKVHAKHLAARLRGTPKEDATPIQHVDKNIEPTSVALVEQDTPKQDIFDGASDDEESGGLLDLLQEMPATEVTDQGTTVHIRDLSLPKHWSGRTPRLLLQDLVHKLDRYALVEFRSISEHSRAKRAALKIVWDRYRDGHSEWSMDDVACHDEIQAEHYIATVAQHSLTFPPMAGFATGATAAASNTTSFRLLPPAFRNLWDELEEKRKENDAATNRAIWAKLKSILDIKLADYKVVEVSHC
jgi:ATP-dependent RNA helicase DHX29